MDSGFDINANYFTDLGIDFKQLLYFVVVAEHMNFSKAAAVLYVTQPLLSQRIAALEKALGCQLLIRGHRGIQLTPAGEVLMEKAREIITLTNDLTSAVRRAASTSHPEGELNIAIEQMLPDSLLTSAVLSYKQDFPRVVFNLFSQPERKVLQQVETDMLDIGILPMSSKRLGPDIVERVVGKDILCFVAAERLLKESSLQEFVWLANRFPTIALEGNNYCTEHILRIYAQLGIAHDFHFCLSLRDLFMQLECGMGVTLLPSRHLPHLAQRGMASCELSCIPAADVPIAAYWREDAQNTLIPSFAASLTDLLSQRPEYME
ncbi:MAG: LysR family transcriptional regulator [Oscillospiraceae bacterium]|nr:LysR family transcriptional regulator [Oscillospiraceae bacterium]